jgi:hypothetical protein
MSVAIPKTAVWIPEPWRLQVDEATQREDASADPISFRVFPLDDNAAANAPPDTYFQNPVMINGYPSAVYELTDLIRAQQRQGALRNPGTNEAYKLTDLNPVRFPGFKDYAQTVALLQNLEIDGQERWTRLPVEDPPEAPTVDEGMGMQYAVRAFEPRTGKRSLDVRIREGLPIMRQVLMDYPERPTNVIVPLDTLHQLFRAEALRHHNSAAAGETLDFVRRLLLIIAKEEQGLGKRNVEVIYPSVGHMEFLLNAVPLMRLAHQFVHALISRGRLGALMHVGLTTAEAIKDFKGYIRTLGAFDYIFTDHLLLVALNNVPGVRFVTDQRGRRTVYINAAAVPAINRLSGFNQGLLLRTPLRSEKRKRKREDPLTEALEAFARTCNPQWKIPSLTILRDRFLDFCRFSGIPGSPDEAQVADCIRRMPNFFEPLLGGGFRVGLIPRPGDPPRSFEADFGDIFRRFIGMIEATDNFVPLRQVLNLFATFCRDQRRYDWDPELYYEGDIRRVLSSCDGVETLGGGLEALGRAEQAYRFSIPRR